MELNKYLMMIDSLVQEQLQSLVLGIDDLDKGEKLQIQFLCQ